MVDLANQAVQNKINSKLDPRPPVEELPPNFNMDPRRARHYLDVEEGEGSVVDLANQAVQNKINSKLDPRPPVEELPPNFNMDPRRPQEFSCLTAYHR